MSRMSKDENEQAVDVVKEMAKEVAKDAYADAGKPILKPTGELVSLIPRAIKAALEPVEKWVLQREYNIAETKKLLEEKLQNTPPEMIQPPEPHIAVPALQYISYCMDNDELRDMYANLLANSMNSVVKNGVHPGFVEIIKQLSPDEAKLLKYMRSQHRIPTLGMKLLFSNGGHATILKDFSNAPELSGCEHTLESEQYIDNLVRLGLMKRSVNEWYHDEKIYEPLKNHSFIRFQWSQYADNKQNISDYQKLDYEKGYCELTAFGKNFCSICLTTTKVVTSMIIDE